MVEHKPVKEFGKMTEIMLMTGNEDKVRGQMQNTPKQEILFTCSGGRDFYKQNLQFSDSAMLLLNLKYRLSRKILRRSPYILIWSRPAAFIVLMRK